MNNQQSQNNSPFEAVRHEDEQGNEYWSARELGKILGYTTNYRNFQKAIKKAEDACQNSEQSVPDHFAYVRNMINTGKGAKREIEDVRLTLYACYRTSLIHFHAFAHGDEWAFLVRDMGNEVYAS